MLLSKRFSRVPFYVIGVLFFLYAATVKADLWQPGANFKQIPIWPNGTPDGPKAAPAPEALEVDENSVGGMPTTLVLNVSRPTMTIYPPKGPNSGTAVVVFPGGGYKKLAIDLEGTEICDWLTPKGITCIVLKYRVPYSGCYWDSKTDKHITPKVPMALQDAQRTISTIRFNAKKYNVNPNKIGVMGFSAGGNLVVLSSTAFKKRSYDAIDEIDKVSSRPDFAIPVYPGHMTMEHKNKIPKEIASKELNTDIVISQEIPPTLLVHGKDDPVDPVYYSELYEKELKKVGVQVRLNTYNNGGHAFGVRKLGKDTDRWTQDALDWLKQQKLL